MSEKREKVMQAAEKLVARGKISQAIKEYRKLLRETPNDANMLNRVGDLYARQDKLDEAVALFQKIAEGYGREGFFVKAIAIYKKIIRLDPTQIDIYERLAELYHRQGLVSEARSQYQVLADYHQKHADMPATIEIHRKMADLEPSDPSPRVKLAELYLKEGLVEETIGEYQRIAEVMLQHERVEEATKVYLRALDVDSEDLAFISEAVLRLREEGEHEAATVVFQAAVELNPEAAKLAERMREHEEAAAREAAAAAEPDVEVVDVTSDEGPGGTPDQVSAEELEEIEASSDIGGVEVTDDGTFVIDLDAEAEVEVGDLDDELGDEAAATALTESQDAEEVGLELEDEFEVDLGRLETAGDESTAEDPMASIDALAASLGLEDDAEVEVVDEGVQADSATALEGDEPADATPAPEAEEPPKDTVETQLAELLAEAEVFGKYGLESKAVRRLEQAIELKPSHLESHRRLLLLHIKRDNEADVIQAADRMLRRDDLGGGSLWEEVLGALATAGYEIGDGQVFRSEVAAAPAAEEAEVEEAEAAAEASEEGLEWLEAAAKSDEVRPEALFDVEEEFFDLAAELEKELVGETEEVPEADLTDTTPSGEESLEEIVEGFKQGVAEVLSPEAYDTHYNLGIAYREMGLVDEAIGEFQLSAKDPGHLVDSCSMLGACFLEKGFPDLAVKWYKRGLKAPTLSEEENLSLLYDLGSVHAATGERETAYEVFVEIYGINSHYRDVVARLEELRAG